ncbi:MAG: cell division protein ZapA [Pseudomonadota bacterium]
MAKVTISLNGRAFTIGCEEGQQAYLRELSAKIDTHVRELSEQVGQIGDLRLLLMASLIISDELEEARGELKSLREQFTDQKGLTSQADARRRADRAKAAELIAQAAERLEVLATAAAADGEDA